jgi:hypothetical protein
MLPKLGQHGASTGSIGARQQQAVKIQPCATARNAADRTRIAAKALRTNSEPCAGWPATVVQPRMPALVARPHAPLVRTTLLLLLLLLKPSAACSYVAHLNESGAAVIFNFHHRLPNTLGMASRTDTHGKFAWMMGAAEATPAGPRALPLNLICFAAALHTHTPMHVSTQPSAFYASPLHVVDASHWRVLCACLTAACAAACRPRSKHEASCWCPQPCLTRCQLRCQTPSSPSTQMQS